MGALYYLISNFCTPSTKSKRKPMQTVEIKVKMDCDGCERRVRNAVATMKGFKFHNYFSKVYAINFASVLDLAS
ncbi:heavy metal transport/detoxification superfamily protein [Medicago truncatula]|uniref:Heavy metal transport/detoxification superfamily protein n=2 Tax=Medicago truncatula TaxID=3880 RepID=G7J0F1_MEDTR|nr:heavy metal transport/detoxification superfamily protein [Medicago truncatula]